jgi:hypothetical protein
MGLATLAMMVWGLGRPALWLDEATSVVATQRTWPNLFLLLRGPDAPPAAQILSCVPAALQRLKYRVVTTGPGGRDWILAVLAAAR